MKNIGLHALRRLFHLSPLHQPRRVDREQTWGCEAHNVHVLAFATIWQGLGSAEGVQRTAMHEICNSWKRDLAVGGRYQTVMSRTVSLQARTAVRANSNNPDLHRPLPPLYSYWGIYRLHVGSPC